MKKRWGLFDENDLFFNRRLAPLLDKAKFRKFKPSQILIGTITILGLYLPYKYYFGYVDYIITTLKNKSQLTIIMNLHHQNHDKVNINKSFILSFLHLILLILFYVLLLLYLHYLLFLLFRWLIPYEQVLTNPRVIKQLFHRQTSTTICIKAFMNYV